jgi:acetate---CoA ligase (ADP-forming)
MDRLFYPRSVLVIGVSEKEDNLGRLISGNLIRYGYEGQLHLIGRNPGKLDGYTIETSFDALPDGIDLAVVLTPAATVPDYLEACGRKGIQYVIVESAGFGELSEDGRALERQVLETARKYGVRIVGPNCVGIISTDSGINTVFVRMEKEEVPPGSISLLSQSGGVVLTYADLFGGTGMGINKAVSVGNKVDLKESDYLAYFMEDEATQFAHCYLESIVAGRRLLDAASKGRKPVVVYKSNTGAASAQIAQSHTAALANDDRIVDAALRQFGMTRAGSFSDIVLYSKGFSMPPVKGRRLAVMSRSGGHAIISADLASAYGFELPPFPPSVLERARQYFRAAVIDPMNPLDVGAVFDFDSYAVIIRAFLEEMRPDGVILVFNYRRETYAKAREIAAALKQMSFEYDTPIALVYFAETDEVRELEGELAYPIFAEVADAMRALAASRDSYLRRQRLASMQWPNLEPQVTLPEGARLRVEDILAGVNGGALLAHEAIAALEAYGIPVAPWAMAEDEAVAVAAAVGVGYPLAVKVVSADILHKSDVGGVVLGIEDEAALKKAIVDMRERLQASHPSADIAGFLLQKMVPRGREVLLGSMRDQSFGPTVVFGLGGIYVEVFDDAAIRVAPITRQDAEEMIAAPRGSQLLAGVRGEAPADKGAIADNLLRLSRLVTDFPQIVEVDINPLVVYETGALAVDARILVD